MTDENEKENSIKENLGGLGQAVIGELEIIGGILTGDPVTQAEGEFNVEAGTLRSETEETLEETDETDETDESK